MTNASFLLLGYYKVFVKIDGETYWDNVYKYNDQSQEEQMSELAEFWNRSYTY